MNELRRAMARAMTEDELLQGIGEAATLYGWRWHHHRRSDQALQIGHRGLPDLVLARRGSILMLELKDATGQLSVDQLAWLQAVNGPLGHTLAERDAVLATPAALLIRPTDYDDVLELLK